MIFVWALAAALASAVGWVLQYRGAREEPSAGSLSPALLLRLGRKPVWLGGIAATALGTGLQAIALQQGRLTQVEPLLVASLVFALPLGALLARTPVDRRELLGVATLSLGLAVFLVIGAPAGGKAEASAAGWLVGGGSIMLAAAAMTLIGLRRHGTSRAVALAMASGFIFGVQDALTKASLGLVGHGLLAVLASWIPYAALATGVYGLLLSQDAYKAGPLAAVLPPLALGEPIAGALVGLVAFGEGLSVQGDAVVVEVLAAIAMVVGGVMLARSPLVHGDRDDLDRRCGRQP